MYRLFLLVGLLISLPVKSEEMTQSELTEYMNEPRISLNCLVNAITAVQYDGVVNAYKAEMLVKEDTLCAKNVPCKEMLVEGFNEAMADPRLREMRVSIPIAELTCKGVERDWSKNLLPIAMIDGDGNIFLVGDK